MTLSVHLLNGRIVGVLVRNEEGALDGATVRVVSTFLEDFIVNVNVVVIDGIIKGNHDHLGNLCRLQFAGNLCAVR